VALAIKTYLSYRIEGSDWAPELAMLRDPALLEGDPDITVSLLRDAAGLVPELAELTAPIIHEDAVLIDADIEVRWCREIGDRNPVEAATVEAARRLPAALDRIAQTPAKTERGRAIKAKQASLVPLPAARVGDP
jgi:hypothetical protein